MKLYHCSPVEIKAIHNNGEFGSFLFFSEEPYSLALGQVVAYSVEIDESEIIPCYRFFFHENCEAIYTIVKEVMNKLKVSEEDAENLLTEKTSVYDVLDTTDFIAEASWWVQRKSAECARILGFLGCELTDEQGAVWMIDAKEVKLTKT